MRKELLLSSILLSFSVSEASAQEYRPYIQAVLGASAFSDADLASSILGTPATGSAELGGAFSFGGEVGVELDPVVEGLRFSISGLHSLSSVGSTSVTANGVTASGDLDTDISFTSVHANVYYDFDIEHEFSPFVGAGLGFTTSSIDAPTVAGLSIDDTSTDFSWSLMVGGNYQLTDNVSVGAQYRFTHVTGLEFSATGDPSVYGLTGGTQTISVDAGNVAQHSLLGTISLRY